MENQQPATLPYGEPRDQKLKKRREKPLVVKPIKHRGAVVLLSLTIVPVITVLALYIDSLVGFGPLPDFVYYLPLVPACYLAILSQRGQDLILKIAAAMLVIALSVPTSIIAALLFMPDW